MAFAFFELDENTTTHKVDAENKVPIVPIERRRR